VRESIVSKDSKKTDGRGAISIFSARSRSNQSPISQRSPSILSAKKNKSPLKSTRGSHGKTSPFKVVPGTKKHVEDLYNAPTIDFPSVENVDEFDQTITPMMLHKKGMIAPSNIQESTAMLKNDKVVPTELVIEKMLLFNY
jgi:hypothetical protein